MGKGGERVGNHNRERECSLLPGLEHGGRRIQPVLTITCTLKPPQAMSAAKDKDGAPGHQGRA